MAQQLRALTVLPETWVHFPATTFQLTIICDSCSRRIQHPLDLHRHCIQMVHRQTCWQKTQTRKKKILKTICTVTQGLGRRLSEHTHLLHKLGSLRGPPQRTRLLKAALWLLTDNSGPCWGGRKGERERLVFVFLRTQPLVGQPCFSRLPSL